MPAGNHTAIVINNHKLNDGSSPLIIETSHSYGKCKNVTLMESKPLNSKVDYVNEVTICAKFHVNLCTEGEQMGEIWATFLFTTKQIGVKLLKTIIFNACGKYRQWTNEIIIIISIRRFYTVITVTKWINISKTALICYFLHYAFH